MLAIFIPASLVLAMAFVKLWPPRVFKPKVIYAFVLAGAEVVHEFLMLILIPAIILIMGVSGAVRSIRGLCNQFDEHLEWQAREQAYEQWEAEWNEWHQQQQALQQQELQDQNLDHDH